MSASRAHAAPGFALRLALAVVLASAAAAATTTREPASRFHGEHGLWVEHDDGRMVVRWLTAAAGRGTLEAVAGDRRIARTRTRAGLAHRANFRTRGATELLLRYGSRDDPGDMHETLVTLRPPVRPPVAVAGVDSLYVVGDTHGEYDALVEGLRVAGLVDAELRWTGGRRHLVFAGDLVDRGPDVRALLWLVYRLEREAAAAGGAVHVVLGNHEVMVMLGDLRYVHEKELQLAELHRAQYYRMFDPRRSVLGRWLASKPGILRVDRVLIAHGGLGERYAGYDLFEYEDSLAAFTSGEIFLRWTDPSLVLTVDSAALQRRSDFFWHEDSAFWHRAFVQSDTARSLLDAVLQRMDADIFVVGHTPVVAIASGYDGRVIAAHTQRHGLELVLLVRTADGYARYRITPDGHQRF
jgi:hypothetical protein